MGALWAFPSRNSDLARSTPPRKRQSKTGTTGSQWAITTEPRSTQRGSLTAYEIAKHWTRSLGTTFLAAWYGVALAIPARWAIGPRQWYRRLPYISQHLDHHQGRHTADAPG